MLNWLADAGRSRQNADNLSYYGNDIIGTLTDKESPARSALVASWSTALDRLAVDTSLSKGDKLAAVQAKVNLREIDGPLDPKAAHDPALVAAARETANAMAREPQPVEAVA